MDHEAIRAELPSLVIGHLPRNVRKFKFRIYDDKPPVSTLGFLVDPEPFEGTVIAITESAIIVKVDRAVFGVVDRRLASEIPRIGARVRVTPYARHHFDGTRVDAPTEERRHTSDGHAYAVRSVILGGAATRLPVSKPRCSELAALIEQIERMPAPDGFRRIAHLLADAGARDFTCVDPDEAAIIKTPPAIRFAVGTSKFSGQVTILYERGPDLYAVELHRDGELVDRVDEVFFDDLGHTLEQLIDDGHWRRIWIETISTELTPVVPTSAPV
jgi:hypothetical protein